MELVNLLKGHLYRGSWLQVMDLAGIFSIPLEVRQERGWASICRTMKSDSSRLEYVPDKKGRKFYYSKELMYCDLSPAEFKMKVKVLPHKDFGAGLREIYERDANDIILQSKEVLSPGTYQLNEKFADFDVKIARYLAENASRVDLDWVRLNPDDKAIIQCDKIRQKVKPGDDAGLLATFANPELPYLSMQGPPGTGKTSFLADLVEHLIEQGVPPDEITCIANTNRAVMEIRSKLDAKAKGPGPITEDILPPGFSEGLKPGIRECPGKIYVGTIHKNPYNAHKYQRDYILIDEASQIPLPLLLYGLRYAREDAVIRVLGDHEQLPPTGAYIRDFDIIPKLSFEETAKRLFMVNAEGESFIEGVLEVTSDLRSQKGLHPRDQLTKEPFLRSLQASQMTSAWGQSLFSLPSFAEDFKDNLKGIPDGIGRRLLRLNFVRATNYRQESAIHALTQKTFYSSVDYRCGFDHAAANLHEAHLLDKSSDDTHLEVLCHDVEEAKTFFGGFKSLFSGIFSGFSKVKKSLDSLLGRRELHQVVKPREDHRKNFDKPIIPFEGRSDEELGRFIDQFLTADAVGEAVPKLDRSTLKEKLLPALRKPAILVTYSRDEDRESFEIMLAGLFLALWETEPFRTSNGLGVVTPYRQQECAMRVFYRKARPDSPIHEEGSGWCATPERFQGRDMSRVAFMAVDGDDKKFLDPSTMFSRNKLNVATSRAGSQQVMIAHSHLVSRRALEDYIAAIAEKPAEERRLLRRYPLTYRKKLVEMFEAAVSNRNAAVVDLKTL